MTVLDFDSDALDLQFSDLRDRVEDYEETWWISDDEAKKVWSSEPTVLSRLKETLLAGVTVQTQHVYADGTSWRHPRPGMHRQIVSALLADYSATDDDCRPPAFLLYGGPGSGKSSSLRPLISRPGMSITLPLDADDVRVALPEFRMGLGSRVVQEESTYVAYGELRARCLSGTPNLHGVCIDSVGSPSYAIDDFNQLRQAGYKVYVLVAQCPLEQALQRIKHRAVTAGRYVDLAYARSIGDRPRQALDTLCAAHDAGDIEMAGWGLFDTSDSCEKGEPRVIAGDGTFGQAGDKAVRPAL